MSLFSADKKWMEAKKAIGALDWVLIVSYYRHIGGTNVFVYALGDRGKRLIVDLKKDGKSVILLDKDGNIEEDTYENVTNSKKLFEHSEEHKVKTVTIEGVEREVTVKC